MRRKRLFTTVLLLFVGASLLTTVFKRVWHARPETNSAGATRDDASGADATVVYCFHRRERCTTCQTLERCGREALDQAFAAQLADGRVQWHVVNVDDTAQRHFQADFKLGATAAIVLVQMRHGRPVRWKKLDEAFEMAAMRDLPGDVRQCVQRELKAFLNGVTAPGS